MPDGWYSDAQRAEVAARLNLFPEVLWDRCVLWGADPAHGVGGMAFGWIARTDGQRDFATVEWQVYDDGEAGDDEISYRVGTSSAKYSAAFAARLHSDHVDCQRVQDVFGPLVEARLVADAQLPAAEPGGDTVEVLVDGRDQLLHLVGPRPGTQYTRCGLDAGLMRHMLRPADYAGMWCRACLDQ